MFSQRSSKAQLAFGGVDARSDERARLSDRRPPSYVSSSDRPSSRNNDHPDELSGSQGELVKTKRRNYIDAYLLWLAFGLFGAHHFYLRRSSFGVIYACTLGLCGVGWLVDAVRLPFLVARSNRQRVAEETDDPKAFFLRYKKDLDDAYLLAFPLGFMGIHRFYLGQPQFGFLYAFTGGLFLIGWLFDMFRLPKMVKEYNWSLERSLASRSQAARREDPVQRPTGVAAGGSQPLAVGGRTGRPRDGGPASWDIVNTPQNPPSYHYSPPGRSSATGRLQDRGDLRRLSYTSFPSPSPSRFLVPPVLPNEEPPPYSR